MEMFKVHSEERKEWLAETEKEEEARIFARLYSKGTISVLPSVVRIFIEDDTQFPVPVEIAVYVDGMGFDA